MASKRSEAVIALGRKLVSHLELGGNGDLLAEWMAHDLADKMDAAASVGPEGRAEASAVCAQAIRDLWACRYELTPGIQGLVDLQRVQHAIQTLDPESPRHRYFPDLQWSARQAGEKEQRESWLSVSEGLDISARELIRYCLVQAVATTIDDTQDWVRAARDAFGEDEPETTSVLFLRPGEDPTLKRREARLAWLQQRRARLENFVAASAVLAKELTEEIDALEPARPDELHRDEEDDSDLG